MSEPPRASTAAKAALSRELSDFLIEFSIALHKHAMYPEGHPSLGPAVEGVTGRLVRLLEERGTLSLGVARNQLVIEGMATEAKNPVLRELAGRLHRHQLGALTFRRGISSRDLRSALALLAIEADRMDQPLGLGPREVLQQWDTVRLYPVTYERLELIGDEADTRDEDDERRTTRTRAAQLWIGLARAAMAADDSEDAQPESTEATFVAKAIDQHPRGTAYDQVIVGYLLQMADEFRARGGETVELKRRMSTLVESLDPGTLQRLLEMGGDAAQRRTFVLSAAQGMSVEAVIDLVCAAGEAEQQTISHSLIRMLQKLAQHTVTGGARRSAAESAVRDQIAQLMRDWSLKDPNPDAYRKALESMAGTGAGYGAAADQMFRPDPKRVVQMALEIGKMGEAVTRAVESLVAAGEAAWLVTQLRQGGSRDAAEPIWDLLSTPDRIRRVAGATKLDVEVLDALVARAGLGAADALLDVLIESESAFARRLLLTGIAGLGDTVGPKVVARLTGQPWYVQRNMLAILSELEDLPPDFSALPYLQHTDPRVRREALRILLGQPETRERALVTALTDTDERNVRVGLQAALEACPETALHLVVSKATGKGSDDLRRLAIRALGAAAHPKALEALLSLSTPKKGLFRAKLPSKTDVYLEALRALHGYPEDPRACQVLSSAVQTKDPDIVHAALGKSA